MNKPTKYVLLPAAGLVALAVVAAVVVAMSFDPNRYRSELERLAKERTGRTLKLQGELKLAFFPSLGASVAGVTLTERGSEQEFVSLESARAVVKLLPLLGGQVVVDGISVSGLKAQLVKEKDGRYNFSDLLEGGAAKPAAKAEPRKEGAAPVSFNIAGIALERASISYRDMNSGHEIALAEVKLHTGRIADNATGKIAFAALARANKPSLNAKLALDGTYALKPDSVALDFTAKLDDSSIRGNISASRTTPPVLSFDLGVDRIDLDRYRADGGSGRGAAAKEAAAKDAPVDLSGLKGLNAKGQLQVGALQVHGLKLADVKTALKAAGGRAELNPHSARLYEGTLAGALTLDANGNRIALKENLQNIAVGPLLRDAAHQDRVDGRGNVALDLTGAGATVNAIKRSLAGTARVQLRDGAIKGVNVAELLNKGRTLLGKQPAQATDAGQKTDFSELSASFAIRNGVAHNDDLELKAPLIRVGGAGDIDIGNSSLNYVAKASLVTSTQGQGGAGRDQLAGLTLPVRLTGPFDAIKYEVDYGAVAGNLAKSKVEEKIKENVGGQVGDRLKGLFGR